MSFFFLSLSLILSWSQSSDLLRGYAFKKKKTHLKHKLSLMDWLSQFSILLKLPQASLSLCCNNVISMFCSKTPEEAIRKLYRMLAAFTCTHLIAPLRAVTVTAKGFFSPSFLRRTKVPEVYVRTSGLASTMGCALHEVMALLLHSTSLTEPSETHISFVFGVFVHFILFYKPFLMLIPLCASIFLLSTWEHCFPISPPLI